jgi:hypothetical protein
MTDHQHPSPTGRRVTRSYPSLYLEHRFSVNDLKRAAEAASISLVRAPFLRLEGDGHEKPVVMDNGLHVCRSQALPCVEWDLLRSGALSHRMGLEEDAKPSAGDLLDPHATFWHTGAATASIWRLYGALGIPEDESVTIRFTYDGMMGRSLGAPGPITGSDGNVHVLKCHTSTIEVAPRTQSLTLWRATDVITAAEMCAEIFQHFQWPGTAKSLEDHVAPYLGRVAERSL